MENTRITKASKSEETEENDKKERKGTLHTGRVLQYILLNTGFVPCRFQTFKSVPPSTPLSVGSLVGSCVSKSHGQIAMTNLSGSATEHSPAIGCEVQQILPTCNGWSAGGQGSERGLRQHSSSTRAV